MKRILVLAALLVAFTFQAFAQAKSKTALPAVDMINHVYFYQLSTNQVTPLEKQAATMKTKTSIMGYGGAKVLLAIDGGTSAVRVPKSDTLRFVINTGGAAPEFNLYKLEVAKKTRQATTQQAKGMLGGGNNSAGGGTIVVNTIQLRPGIYQIVPASKLDSGEYFFMAKPTLSSANSDAYAFAID